MVLNDKILQAIYNVVDEINQHLPANQKIEKREDEELYGKKGKLDSLGLVNLIVATERNIEESFNVQISLTDERAMSLNNSPFGSISALAGFITELIENQNGD